MKLTRTSMLTGVKHTMDLDVTDKELEAHANGKHAQRAFPRLNQDEREFLISGVTREEWDALIGDEE